MIRLTTRDGKTVITVAVSATLIDKNILQHRGIPYVYVGKLKGDWVFEEATVGEVS